MARKIRALMAERGISAGEMSEIMRINPQHFSDYMAGVRYLTIEHLMQIAAYLDLPVQELFNPTEEDILELREHAVSAPGHTVSCHAE